MPSMAWMISRFALVVKLEKHLHKHPNIMFKDYGDIKFMKPQQSIPIKSSVSYSTYILEPEKWEKHNWMLMVPDTYHKDTIRPEDLHLVNHAFVLWVRISAQTNQCLQLQLVTRTITRYKLEHKIGKIQHKEPLHVQEPVHNSSYSWGNSISSKVWELWRLHITA